MARKKKYNSSWRKRSKALRQITDHCVVCFQVRNLHVHHVNYSGKRGSDKERPEDLVVLCQSCHAALHPSGGKGRGLGMKNFVRFRDTRRAARRERSPIFASIEGVTTQELDDEIDRLIQRD